MTDEKFNQAIDEIVGFIVDVNMLQMSQLKCNIKAVHEANGNTLDADIIAQQIMNLPFNPERVPDRGIKPAQPAIRLKDEMVCTAEKRLTIDEVGDLNDLSYVKVATGAPHGKEFYHHCPRRGDGLVRLKFHSPSNKYQCGFCGQDYCQK